MENYITASELAILLAVLWLPVFALAAIPQWRLLVARRRPVTWLLAALLLEVLVAFCIWLSPLHRFQAEAALRLGLIQALDRP